MSKQKNARRIGLISRIDYGAKGFRWGLIEHARKVFRREDVQEVHLVGGLIDGKKVWQKRKDLEKAIKAAERDLKRLRSDITSHEWQIEDDDTHPSTRKRLQRELKEMRKREEEEQIALDGLRLNREDLESESMARALVGLLPRFTDRKGKSVSLLILTSPQYDREIGREVAELLHQSREREDIKVLKSGGDDSKELWSGDVRRLQMLTPDKYVWGGKYASTPVEKLNHEKDKQSSRLEEPYLRAIGCIGVSLMRPKGQENVPYVTVPSLSRIERMGGRENQIGVRIVEVYPDRKNPLVRDYDFRDLVSRERSFIGVPGQMDGDRRAIIDALREHGASMETSQLVEATKLSRKKVMKVCQGLVPKDPNRPRSTWPGLEYFELSDRWDFRLDWVQRFLRYPDPPEPDEVHIDSFAGFGCLHFGSYETDYRHFLEGLPKVILEKDVRYLLGVGDFVEGQAHNMLEREQVIQGQNVSKQENGAAHMIADVMFEVWEVRFERALKRLQRKPKAKAAAEMVHDALITFLFTPGNHCMWIERRGIKALREMRWAMVDRLVDRIEKELLKRRIRVDQLSKLVKSRIVEVPYHENHTLSSGLKIGLLHPHMSGTKTHSIRLEQALWNKRDCHIMGIANFHTAMSMHQWTGILGQRICVEFPTLKHGSPFEDSKMKTVDQGYGDFLVASKDGRILWTESTFYSNHDADVKRLDPDMFFYDFLRTIGIEPSVDE